MLRILVFQLFTIPYYLFGVLVIVSSFVNGLVLRGLLL
nr:MAG TPA: hypothetical protein [Caudoviricetes sp.]